jgi:hypothetical protein
MLRVYLNLLDPGLELSEASSITPFIPIVFLSLHLFVEAFAKGSSSQKM